uniref:Uncharacterized protein n=1 Tax=Zea mays TaxID=4577 RepID=A0A804PIJ2_MAIZE
MKPNKVTPQNNANFSCSRRPKNKTQLQCPVDKKKHIPQLVQPLSYQPKPYTIYSEPVINFDNSENATPPPEVSFYNKCSYKPPPKKKFNKTEQLSSRETFLRNQDGNNRPRRTWPT